MSNRSVLPSKRNSVTLNYSALSYSISGVIMLSLVVGVAVGWFLDKILGTYPFLLLVFFLFGGAVGVISAYYIGSRSSLNIDSR